MQRFFSSLFRIDFSLTQTNWISLRYFYSVAVTWQLHDLLLSIGIYHWSEKWWKRNVWIHEWRSRKITSTKDQLNQIKNYNFNVFLLSFVRKTILIDSISSPVFSRNNVSRTSSIQTEASVSTGRVNFASRWTSSLFVVILRFCLSRFCFMFTFYHFLNQNHVCWCATHAVSFAVVDKKRHKRNRRKKIREKWHFMLRLTALTCMILVFAFDWKIFQKISCRVIARTEKATKRWQRLHGRIVWIYRTDVIVDENIRLLW